MPRKHSALAEPRNPTKAEVAAEVEFFLSQHQGVAYITEKLRTRPVVLARRLARAGRNDLARVFTTQSTIPWEYPEERTTA